jgi:hypothetical protein
VLLLLSVLLLVEKSAFSACCLKSSTVSPILGDCSHTLPRVRRSCNGVGHDCITNVPERRLLYRDFLVALQHASAFVLFYVRFQ